MLSFRDKQLQFPKFQFKSKASIFDRMCLSRHDEYTFMPYYGIDFIFRGRFSREMRRRLSRAIIAKFGYIPFGSAEDGKNIVGYSFSIEQFADPVFVKDFAELLYQQGVLTESDKRELIGFFELHGCKLVQYLQEEAALHNVPEAQTRLIHLIDKSDPTVIQVAELLENPDIDINAQDGYGHTALLRAAQKSRTDLVELLLKRGADPHLLDWFGSNALDHAAYCDKLDIARLLLEHGADPARFWWDSPMHHAFSMASDEMVALLAQYGARTDIKNGKGETPVNQSINWRHHDNGEAVRRRVKIAEKGRREYLLKGEDSEELREIMRRDLLAHINKFTENGLERFDAVRVSVEAGILTVNDLIEADKCVRILSRPFSQGEYNVWFKGCLSLVDMNVLITPPLSHLSKNGLANLPFLKKAFIAWVKSLKIDDAIRLCRMACDQKSFFGNLMYKKRGWRQPSLKRGTLKEINDYLQTLLLHKQRVANVERVMPLPVKNAAAVPKVVRSATAEILNVVVEISEPVTAVENIDIQIRDLTRSGLYPDLSSEAAMQTSCKLLEERHAKIAALQAERRQITSDVDQWLFGHGMFARPRNLPEPLMPVRLNLQEKARLAAETDNERHERIVNMLDALPAPPKQQIDVVAVKTIVLKA